MAWPPPSTFPLEPPIRPGWWVELSYHRHVARGRADRQAREQDRRLRQLRRRVERLDEAIVLAQSASEARRASAELPNAPVEFRDALVSGVNFDQRIVELVAMPFGQRALVEYRGEVWAESFDRGAFDGIETRKDQVRVNRNHDKTMTVGKVVRWWPSRSEGLVSEVRIAPTPLGDETMTLADENMLSASIGFAVRGSDQLLDKASMTRRIRKAIVDHLSFVEDAAYPGARVLAVRDRAR